VNAAVVLNLMHRLANPLPPAPVCTPQALRLQEEPRADCARYDSGLTVEPIRFLAPPTHYAHPPLFIGYTRWSGAISWSALPGSDCQDSSAISHQEEARQRDRPNLVRRFYRYYDRV